MDPSQPRMEQGGSVAASVDQALYPVAVLIDELRHDDLQLRLNSVRNLETIALALGTERTHEELLPFLQEIVDDDDEVLICLAEQLGQGISWVGGPASAHFLMGPLEELCSVEEITVRESAVEALREVSKHLSSDQVSPHLCSLISRVASHDWFTARISACSLFAVALPKVAEAKQDDLLKIFFKLCSDDTPMVRRQAAKVLGSVAEVLQRESALAEFLDAFDKLSKDEQDSVRILAIGNCITLGALKTDPDWQAQVLQVVKACAEDRSWRVRYMVVDNVRKLCDVFQTTASSAIVPLYVKLLADQEVEVRTIAAARIAAVSSLSPTREFLEMLMPAMEKLTLPREHSQHVRASFAGSILSLAPIFGAKLTVDFLINIFLQLIRDDCPEVRLKLVSTLGELSSVVGVDVLSQSLIPSIRELGKDRQWRVRLAVIDCTPELAKYLGETTFTKELSPLFTTWLVDPVFSVRDAAASRFRQLSEVLGLPWCETHIVPQLQALIAHKNYLCRISAVLCAGSLADIAPTQFFDQHLVPIVTKLSGDPVPNVRFNAAKTIQAIYKACMATQPASLEANLLPCLWRMLADDDPDVKFFTKRAMTEIGVKVS